MRKEIQLALQIIWNLFYASGDEWPTFRQFKQELDRRVDAHADAARIVRRIPATWLKAPSSRNGYIAMNERLVLTPEGIKRCAGGRAVLSNLPTAARWLGKRVAGSELSNDQREHGIPFTERQLAEALSLSDPVEVSRIVAILQSEGLVQDDGSTRDKPSTPALLGVSARPGR